MNEADLQRYSRQLLLPEFDITGQLSLAQSHVVIVGLGGLGNIAALFLASAGVGALTLVDDDQIEVSNLPRQVLYRQTDIGVEKVEAAKNAIAERNPDVRVTSVCLRLDKTNVDGLIQGANLVLECSDNFSSRQALHRAAAKAQIPLVSGAAIRWEGQLVSFRYDEQVSACYECLYPNMEGQDLSCNVNGILGPVVGMIGTFQALEAIKLLSGTGEVEHGKLKLFDGLSGRWRELRVGKDPVCPFCSIENS